MKNLIICEKPSLAKNVCLGLKLNGESFVKKENYFESNNYIVTAVFGHLFVLYDVDDYTNTKEKWNIESLPFIPDIFKYKLKLDYKTKTTDKIIQKQFNLIKGLIHSDNVSSITNCGDSDREGQIIIDIVLNEAKNNKPVYRLWLPEQTEETIAQEIKKMKSNSEYQALANEGYARQKIDWIYGINYTRYASVKSQTLLRVGRVITTILKIIYDREKEVDNFISIPYYQLISKELNNDIEVELIVKEKYDDFNNFEMNTLLQSLNNNQSIVSDIVKKDKIIQAPKLFSQSDLQNHLSKQFKYSPGKTLELTQALYEKGYVSYPRTPTNYLANNEQDKVQNIINNIVNKQQLAIVFKDSKRIFDDSKIESHSAIIPTTKLADLTKLSEDEKTCYMAIFNRFCAIFCSEEHKVAETIIKVVNSDYIFELKGSTMLSKGFLMFDEPSAKKSNNEIPNVAIGDVINSDFKIVKKMTTPPKYWSVETLNNFLKNPFRKENDTEDEIYNNLLKGLEIGTEATRSGIIDNAIKSEYITLKNSTYRLSTKGEYLVDSINKLGIDVSTETSANLGADLKSIYRNEKSEQELISNTRLVLENVISNDVEIEKHHQEIESIGLCPICQQYQVVENKAAYTCQDKECRFVIFKDNNFITKIGKKKLTNSMVKNLITNKYVYVKSLTSKAGKKYDAKIILDITDKWINLKPDFTKNK